MSQHLSLSEDGPTKADKRSHTHIGFRKSIGNYRYYNRSYNLYTLFTNPHSLHFINLVGLVGRQIFKSLAQVAGHLTQKIYSFFKFFKSFR